MTPEKARSILILRYGIYTPTQKQIAMFILYGNY